MSATETATQWDKDKDAVAAAPNSHIVLYEDENRRELAVILKPGVREPWHHHAWPSEIRVMRSADLRFYKEGDKVLDIPKKDVTPDKPFVEQLDPEPLHSVENLSDTDTYFAIRVEFKSREVWPS